MTHASDVVASDDLAPDEAPSEGEILSDSLARLALVTRSVDATVADGPVDASDLDEPKREALAMEAKRIEQSLTRLRYWLLRQ
jgi:hypothetical protein